MGIGRKNNSKASARNAIEEGVADFRAEEQEAADREAALRAEIEQIDSLYGDDGGFPTANGRFRSLPPEAFGFGDHYDPYVDGPYDDEYSPIGVGSYDTFGDVYSTAYDKSLGIDDFLQDFDADGRLKPDHKQPRTAREQLCFALAEDIAKDR